MIRWLGAWEDLRKQGQELAKQSNTQTYSPLSGEAQELLALADDVSRVLQLENRLPKKLKARLLNRNEFQGAHYELAIAATFIRTNFKIDWVDDSAPDCTVQRSDVDSFYGLRFEADFVDTAKKNFLNRDSNGFSPR